MAGQHCEGMGIQGSLPLGAAGSALRLAAGYVPTTEALKTAVVSGLA